QVATFTDPGNDTAGEFTATIDWGDGTTSAGTVSGSGGTYTVTGDHTYTNTDGTFTVFSHMRETGVGRGFFFASGTATVAENDLAVSGTSFSATENTALADQQVATFTDPGADTTDDFTVTIDWGDGTSATDG